MEVAARENASSQSTVYELKDLLQKIALQDKVEESREFARESSRDCIRASAGARQNEPESRRQDRRHSWF